MNRRELLKGIVAAPVVVAGATPECAVTLDPMREVYYSDGIVWATKQQMVEWSVPGNPLDFTSGVESINS